MKAPPARRTICPVIPPFPLEHDDEPCRYVPQLAVWTTTERFLDVIPHPWPTHRRLANQGWTHQRNTQMPAREPIPFPFNGRRIHGGTASVADALTVFPFRPRSCENDTRE